MKKADTALLCTLPEVSRRTGLGIRQIRRAIRAGEITVIEISSWPRLRWSEVVAWIESKARRGEEGAPETGP